MVVRSIRGEPKPFPAGAHCFAEEVNGQGADEVSVSHDSFDNAAVIEAGESDEVQELELRVTNSFNSASLVVSRDVAGESAPAGEEFTFNLACTYPTADSEDTVTDVTYPLPIEDTVFTLAPGESREIPVPAGVTCTVSEGPPNEVASAAITDSDSSSSGSAGAACRSNP